MTILKRICKLIENEIEWNPLRFSINVELEIKKENGILGYECEEFIIFDQYS